MPGNLKTAKVIPIFKSGDNTVLNNYRPISILPAISKVLEKLVCNRLVGFLQENDKLYKHQYGFRSKHSTTHPVLQLIKDIADANDKNTKDATLAVFIDLSKAFDAINHDIMLHKLQFYGIRGIYNSWFANYLSNRKQFTEIGNSKSSHKYLTTGVPQGSILGPILFLIYINDIKNCTNKLSVLSYADDTTVYLSGPNTNEMIDIMNTELKKLYDWLCANRLSLNIKKTNCCIFSPSSKKYTCNKIVSLNNQTITQIGEQNKDDAIKFLGIYIDRHVTWKKHINIICSKISKATFVINRVKHFLPHCALKYLYYTLIHSHMTYGIQAWGNSTSITKLGVLQKRVIRIINKKRHRSHTDPIFKSESILKISDLYKLHVSLFMFDLQNGSLPISFKTYIQQSETATHNTMYTRQHGLLKKERARTTFSSKLPKHNFTNIWNNISENIRNAVNRLLFKFILHNYYTDKYESLVICTNPTCPECRS